SQVEASGRLDDLLTDEFWLVISKPEFAADGQPIDHEVEDVVEQFQTAHLRDAFKYLAILFAARGKQFDLVGDAPHECRIHQIRWLQVGRKYQKLIEWQ